MYASNSLFDSLTIKNSLPLLSSLTILNIDCHLHWVETPSPVTISLTQIATGWKPRALWERAGSEIHHKEPSRPLCVQGDCHNNNDNYNDDYDDTDYVSEVIFLILI